MKISFPISFNRQILYRKDEIIRLCENKKVLHLGFIQHSHLYQKLIEEGNWLHNKIGMVASKLVGIDFLREEVNRIREKYNMECYYGDVCALDQCEHQDKYDVVVCGELIEHLENPGLALEGIKNYLNREGILIITTPNPWSWTRLKLLKRGILEKEWLNPEHTCWFSYGTLNNFLERKDYSKVYYTYYYDESKEKEYRDKKGLVRTRYQIKDGIRKRILPKHYFRGLFFVCKAKCT